MSFDQWCENNLPAENNDVPIFYDKIKELCYKSWNAARQELLNPEGRSLQEVLAIATLKNNDEVLPLIDYALDHRENIDLLGTLMQYYSKDPSAPGILISFLPTKEYYIAIHRYRGKYGKDKIVITNAKHKDFKVAYQMIIEQILRIINNAAEQL
jgi:hypothetical protein